MLDKEAAWSYVSMHVCIHIHQQKYVRAHVHDKNVAAHACTLAHNGNPLEFSEEKAFILS